MSVRMRHTKGHTRNRRSHHALDEMNVITDEKGGTRLPHRVDEKTGMYRGKQIFEPKVKKDIAPKAKGPSEKTEAAPAPAASTEEHANAEVKASEKTERANERSGTE